MTTDLLKNKAPYK